jgi:hypothetical protein
LPVNKKGIKAKKRRKNVGAARLPPRFQYTVFAAVGQARTFL